MPKFLENKLRAEYGNNSRAIYGTLNNIGAMHGNKITPKGKAMEVKHVAKMRGAAPKIAAKTGQPRGPSGPRGSSMGHPHVNLGKYLHPAKGRR